MIDNTYAEFSGGETAVLENGVLDGDPRLCGTSLGIDAEAVAAFHSPLLDEFSGVAVGKWNRLISRTNWEKGRIICEWRQKLIDAGLPEVAYCDESWTKRVRDASNNAAISPQHVGRLRRVYDRFGQVYTRYETLFWSHFQAATAWDDAEMWLEGALQNGWSVMQMRMQRWEALGAPAELKPSEGDILTAELDEDVNARTDGDLRRSGGAGGNDDSRIEQADKAKGKIRGGGSDPDEPPFETGETVPSTGEVLLGMKSMEELPGDLYEAFEQLKMSILNHKAMGFREVDPQRIILFLNAMKQMVLSQDAD